ncbi:MAG TPA: hydantoinase B/oxoprolinase family protein [Solirubrobacterales bacterium]|nr:hydantoinase B/oxoprolinase family protein [Solirubrobacterales bacterium]
MYDIAVDIGGTFTDCVIHDAERELVMAAKAPSRRDNLGGGVLDSVEAAAERLGVPLEQVLANTRRFIHGSTVATNAMIERDGARTAYVTTAGHEDTLAIGKIFQKRAGLSEREISHLNRLQMADPPLVPRELVFGVQERMDYRGRVVVALSDAEIAATIERVRESGVESVAVCLLWSFIEPEHERRLTEAMRAALPDVYVSASVDVSPVLGEYERGVTTALNAYLGPPISRYLGGLQELLSENGLSAQVLLMTAGGGVVSIDSARDKPVTLLDSGPVGGTLGSRFVGSGYDEENIICTDVGGTSFDVSLVIGEEFQLEHEPVIAQYVFKIPKVAVKSIGAGGGSIAWVDGLGVLKVGPQSAGARPGPACYGRGGELPTVTDANLILGYLNPDNFLGGAMTLDREAAVRAFEPLAEQLGLSVEEAAAGVHKIMNSHMADLLRGSTIERGHDPRDFELFAYGGAAATHAVGYSAEAGVRSIRIPADATAFSALGMLTADLTHSFERGRPVSTPFSDEDFETMASVFAELGEQATEQLRLDGEDPEEATMRRSLLMRFRAQVHEIEIDVPAEISLDAAGIDALIERFTERYEQTYGEGSAYPDAGVEITTFRLTATIPTSLDAIPGLGERSGSASEAKTGTRDAYFEGAGFGPVDVYDGERLAPGNRVEGPAVIERYGDTVLIPPGLAGEMDGRGSITVEIGEAAVAGSDRDRVSGGRLDPITYEVIRNRLWAINDEQAQTAARKSGSQFIYEAFDFNAGLLDGDGNGLFAGVYVLFHTTGLDMTVKEIMRRFPDISDGDVFITNDPWVGAIHFNDFVTVTPIFADGEIVSWAALVMHYQDVGGPVPGSFVVGSHNVFEECPIITPLKLMDKGRYCQEVEDLLLRNTRTPMMNGLNLRATVASQITTKRRVLEIVERYGVDALKAATAQVQEEVEETVRGRLAEIPDGEWYDHVYLDHDGHSYELYEVKLRLIKRDGKLIFDFTGTSEQAPGMINGTISGLRGGVMTAVLVMLGYEMPWSTGGLRNIIEIVSEPGTINNCEYPAPCSGGSVCAEEATENVAGTVIGKMLGASAALREESMTVWYPYFNIVILAGIDQYGEPLASLMFDNSAGGGGARLWGDGVDCGGYFESVSCVCPNVESNEKIFPVLELYRRRAAGSYGHGQRRGGTGIEFATISYDVDDDLEVIVTNHGAAQPGAPGLYGGFPCALNTNVILRDADTRERLGGAGAISGEAEVSARGREVLEAKARTTLSTADVLITRNEGGPGYGDPLRRDPAAVAADVRTALCTCEDAEEIYGVALDGDGFDADATAARREQLKAERLADSVPVGEAVARYGVEGVGAAR